MSNFTDKDIIAAHKYSSKHREELLKVSNCGYFYCFEIFHPYDIEEWVDEGQTAICPHCGIDSIIGENSGYELTMDFLIKMREYWFGVK